MPGSVSVTPAEQAAPCHPGGGLLPALAHNPFSKEILGCLCVWVSGKLDVLRTIIIAKRVQTHC